MLRKTLTTLSLIGLLISVGLWGASYFDISYRTHNPVRARECAISINGGAVGYVLLPSGGSSGWRSSGFEGFETLWLPGYEYEKSISLLWAWWIPLWIPTLLFAALFLCCRPYRFSRFNRRRKRRKLGLCLRCGYDLRGSKERCPECGTEFGKSCSEKP